MRNIFQTLPRLLTARRGRVGNPTHCEFRSLDHRPCTTQAHASAAKREPRGRLADTQQPRDTGGAGVAARRSGATRAARTTVAMCVGDAAESCTGASPRSAPSVLGRRDEHLATAWCGRNGCKHLVPGAGSNAATISGFAVYGAASHTRAAGGQRRTLPAAESMSVATKILDRPACAGNPTKRVGGAASRGLSRSVERHEIASEVARGDCREHGWRST